MIAERMRALRESLPNPVLRREIRVPDEVPGYRNWLNESGFDHWRSIGRALYDDGKSILVWSPASTTALLILGAEAEAVRGRVTRP